MIFASTDMRILIVEWVKVGGAIKRDCIAERNRKPDSSQLTPYGCIRKHWLYEYLERNFRNSASGGLDRGRNVRQVPGVK